MGPNKTPQEPTNDRAHSYQIKNLRAVPSIISRGAGGSKSQRFGFAMRIVRNARSVLMEREPHKAMIATQQLNDHNVM
jgi:hypothetical protein